MIDPDRYAKLYDDAWAKLPRDIKERAIGRLKLAYDESFFDEVRKLVQAEGLNEWLPVGWHFMQGMHVRNVLRSDVALREMIPVRKVPLAWFKTVVKIGVPEIPDAIKDAELPPLPEYYDGQTEGNWDDYYVQCIEAAAGLREI